MDIICRSRLNRIPYKMAVYSYVLFQCWMYCVWADQLSTAVRLTVIAFCFKILVSLVKRSRLPYLPQTVYFLLVDHKGDQPKKRVLNYCFIKLVTNVQTTVLTVVIIRFSPLLLLTQSTKATGKTVFHPTFESRLCLS